MPRQERKIVWVDVETSGVDHDNDRLLEVGAIITDMDGVEIDRGAVYTSLISVNNLGSVMSESSPVVQEMHERSGLWRDLWNEKGSPSHVVESEMLVWLSSYTSDDDILYFGGNSVTLDRNFLRTFMPSFYSRISFRSIDVSTLSVVLRSSGLAKMYHKESKHRALADIYESLGEYRHYLEALEFPVESIVGQ